MKTRLVGILNITPNSFSDGGLYFSHEDAINHTFSMIREGATIIDMGAESTSPSSTMISEEEEFKRLVDILPKIVQICKEHSVETSLDTRKSNIATFGISHGIDYINDVSGCSDPAMLDVISRNPNVKLIAVHGLLGDKNVQEARGAVDEIIKWSEELIAKALEYNITKDRIIIDPGVGFGKNAEYSWNIIKSVEKLKKKLGVQLYIGHSRKSFLRADTDLTPVDSDLETLIISSFLANHSVEFIRVHNIGIHIRMLKMLQNLGMVSD